MLLNFIDKNENIKYSIMRGKGPRITFIVNGEQNKVNDIRNRLRKKFYDKNNWYKKTFSG